MFERIKASFARLRQQKQSLPDYGLLYFDNLCGEYHSLPTTRIEPEEKAIIDKILDKRRASLNWSDLYTFDLTLARLQPLEKLPRIVWSLRSRYRDVAGLREYDAYLASKPPELASVAKKEDLQADMEYLIGQLHLRYAMSPVRENIRDWLSKVVAYITLVGLIVVIIFTFLLNRAYPDSDVEIFATKVPIRPSTLTLVLFVGAMGGLVSMQQRFQSVSDEGDPIDNVSELARGWFSIFLSPISGAIFAAMLYLIITAGLLQGDLFPEIISSPLPSDVEPAPLVWFLQKTGPIMVIDYAKLLIWSFIAGFAERLVPDTLSRFIERRETNSGASV